MHPSSSFNSNVFDRKFYTSSVFNHPYQPNLCYSPILALNPTCQFNANNADLVRMQQLLDARCYCQLRTFATSQSQTVEPRELFFEQDPCPTIQWNKWPKWLLRPHDKNVLKLVLKPTPKLEGHVYDGLDDVRNEVLAMGEKYDGPMTSSGDFVSKSSSSMNYLKKASFKSPEELGDVVSLVIFCAVDSTMMLVIEPYASDYWIPSVKVSGTTSWSTHMAKDLIQDIFGTSVGVDKMMRLNKLWMPSSFRSPYLCHAVFRVPVKMDMKKKSRSLFGKYKGKIRWTTFDELLKFHSSNLLKSPELIEYMTWELNRSSPIVNIPPEFTLINNYLELSEQVLVTGKNTIYDQLVDSSGLERLAQEVLYKEFILMSFPALFLTQQLFCRFVIDMGWPKDQADQLFRSADMYGRGGISFREFLYFLAATEPGTSHGGGPAELRCRYIFRFLDTDKNNLLKRDELRQFITLLRKSRRQPLDAAAVEKELTELYQAIGLPENHALTMSEFLRAVGELKVRGTSQIYRAPCTIQKHIKAILERDSKVTTAGDGRPSSVSTSYYPRSQNYELATHSIKIQRAVTAINIEQVWNIENAASLSSLRSPASDMFRKFSASKFDQSSKSNELLKAIRYLVQVNATAQCYQKLEGLVFNWGVLDPHQVAKYLNAVCVDVKEILKKEARLLEIPSPVYVLGDLHGNIADLLCFEKILWPVGPGLCACNLLFLGDYVDRGVFSFEVACYLLAYKLQVPRKVYLLRGNHEVKRVQVQWTFERECRLKFGEKLGAYVFNTINDVFDALPLAAAIDGRIFCCHGGIPPPWLCPVAAAINDVPVLLNEPQDQSTLAWELMWNDPVKTKLLNDGVAMELMANEGFAANSRRGTGHVFSVEALERFLSANGFSHLVRAHEVADAGFYLQQKGLALTVFSSSKYCGGTNMAACLLADQGQLRVLRLETDDA